jgi:hypothetical protein
MKILHQKRILGNIWMNYWNFTMNYLTHTMFTMIFLLYLNLHLSYQNQFQSLPASDELGKDEPFTLVFGRKGRSHTLHEPPVEGAARNLKLEDDVDNDVAGIEFDMVFVHVQMMSTVPSERFRQSNPP